jgi:sec-independent protein translocase protein TatA
MFGLGLWEALIVLAVVLLLFGGKKLPQLGSALGKSLVNFKKGMKEGIEEKSDDPDQKND